MREGAAGTEHGLWGLMSEEEDFARDEVAAWALRSERRVGTEAVTSRPGPVRKFILLRDEETAPAFLRKVHTLKYFTLRSVV